MPPQQPAPSRISWIVLAIAFILVLLGAGYFLYSSNWGAQSLALLKYKDVYVLQGTFGNPESVDKISSLSINPVELDIPGKLIDLDRAQGVTVAIVETAPSTQDVYIVGGQRLTVDGGVKSSVSISADGKTVGYVQYAEPVKTLQPLIPQAPHLILEEGSTTTLPTELEPIDEIPMIEIDAPLYDVGNWVVKTIDISTGIASARGIGFGPQFFSYGGNPYVLFTSPDGIETVNLQSDGREILRTEVDYLGDRAARVSPDGTYLLLYTLTGYQRYTIQSMQPFAIKAGQAFPPGIMSATFNGNMLYLVVINAVQPRAAQMLVDGTEFTNVVDVGRPYRIIP